jgi:hypothetical protein
VTEKRVEREAQRYPRAGRAAAPNVVEEGKDMKLTKHLIPDWKASWRFLSVQINAGVTALAAAVFASAPGLVIGVLRAGALERIVVAAMICAAFIFPHWLARVLAQPRKGPRNG